MPATGVAADLNAPRRSQQARPGFQMDGGWWLDRRQTVAVEGGFLTLDDWYRRRDPAPVSTPVATYNAATASVTSRYSSAEANVRALLLASDPFRVEGLVGYRYAGLHERGWVDSVTPDQDVGVVEYLDRAKARNDFHGGQVGLAARWQSDLWALEATGKVAFGGVWERADLTGDSANALLAGGAALPHLSRTQFAVLPAVSATLSRRVWGNSRVFVGVRLPVPEPGGAGERGVRRGHRPDQPLADGERQLLDAGRPAGLGVPVLSRGGRPGAVAGTGPGAAPFGRTARRERAGAINRSATAAACGTRRG